jgi:hypothetical protein
VLDIPGVSGGGTWVQSNAEQERPYLAAMSGKDRAYKAGRLKSRGARRESERSTVPTKASQDNALEGRGLALITLVRR